MSVWEEVLDGWRDLLRVWRGIVVMLLGYIVPLIVAATVAVLLIGWALDTWPPACR